MIASGALIFDDLTPQMVEVGLFYVAIVLTGFWFSNPKAALWLAAFATPLIILGYWLAIPDSSPEWAAWLNRVLAIATTWLTAAFVWRNRVLAQKLQAQVDIATGLSREMSHRVGNSLQLVASYLRLQAATTADSGSRRVLEVAGSRVMVIGKIQRMLSHTETAGTVDMKAFIGALVREVRSTLPEPDRIGISVAAEVAEITATTAVALGALLVELINNALKHAFPAGMDGTLAVRFSAFEDEFVVEVEDDGVGIDRAQNDGFGTRSVAELARLVDGSITCRAAGELNSRPGTIWRLVFPRHARE